MKNFVKILIFSLFPLTSYAQLATEIDSKSVKLPRYASEVAVATAIPTPTQGMLIYRTDTKSNWYYDGTSWKNISTATVGSGGWTSSAFGIYPTNLAQNVGIGMDQPIDKLEINGDMSIMNNGSLEFGKYISGKETNAGKIGYELFTDNTLDIVGAGNSYPERKIRFWAEGESDFTGPIRFNGALKPAGNAGTAGQVLTSNGTASPTWSNQAFTNNIRFGVEFHQNNGFGFIVPIYNTIYNTNPSAITIVPGSLSPYIKGGIIVSKTGLYRLNGYMSVEYWNTSIPTAPWITTFTLSAGPMTYVIKNSEALILQNSTTPPYLFVITAPFNFDVYLTSLQEISILMSISVGSGSAGLTSSDKSGVISGYLISE